MAGAPAMLDRLEGEDAEHFATVRRLLDEAGVPYELDPTLVRGLDYYTRTVFEFTSGSLGAQSALGGGGRYDGLIEVLGGPPTPAIGFAAGIERILMAMDDTVRRAAPDGVRGLRRRRGRVRADPGVAPPPDRRPVRPRRPRLQGPDEAGEPLRCRLRGDPRGGRLDQAPRHGERRAARRSAAPSCRPPSPSRPEQHRNARLTRDDRRSDRLRNDAVRPQHRRVPGALLVRGERLPRHVVRSGARRPRRLRDPGRRLGPSPPRPRRPDLHRPARPHRPRAARLRSGRDQRRGLRARPQTALRGRAHRRRQGRRARRRRRQRRDGDRRLRRSGSARPSCSPTPRRRRSRSRASAARPARTRACATAISTSAASRCARRSCCAASWSRRCAASSTARASSRSRRRS